MCSPDTNSVPDSRVVEWLGTIVCYVDCGKTALQQSSDELLQTIRETCVDAFRHLNALGVDLPPTWMDEASK